MKIKPHLLVLVDSYYPNATMNGIIAKRIVDEIKNDYQITIITYESPNSKLTNEDINFCDVFNWSWFYEYYLLSKLKLSKYKFLWFVLYKLKKVFSNLIRNISTVGIDLFVMHRILDKIKLINNKNHIDIILSISAPFEFQVSNYLFKKSNPDIRSILFQVDFWSELSDVGLPKILKKWRYKNRVELEVQMAKLCEYVMVPFVHEKENVSDKIKVSQLPLLVPNFFEIKERNINEDKLSIVYAGTLSRRERNPENILKTMISLSRITRLIFDIYHRGDCGDIIDTYVADSNSIINHGVVPNEKALAAIANADILIMLGTPDGQQIAGKSFEYIVTGKKIIYIYQNSEDINLRFLHSYPSLLAISNNELLHPKSLSLLKEYIEKDNGIISYSEIKNIFSDALPEKFCRRFFDVEK